MAKGARRVPGVSSAMPRPPAAETDRVRSGGTQRDYPVLRTLLSAPPLKSADEEQVLMRKVTSAFADEQQAAVNPSGNKSLSSAKPAGSKARSQTRQLGFRAGHEYPDSHQTCPSPDTTIRSPPMFLHSGTNYPAWTPMGARLPNRGQQNVHYSYFNSAPNFIQSVQNTGYSEQNTPQWIHSQQVHQHNHGLPAYPQALPVQTKPIALFHKKYGMTEYYFMQPQGVNQPAPIPSASYEYPDVPVKRMKIEGYCNQNSHDMALLSNSSCVSVPHPGHTVQPQFGGYHRDSLHSCYQTVQHPVAEIPQQSPFVHLDEVVADTAFWEGFEKAITGESRPPAPCYEDISPCSDAPSCGFGSHGSDECKTEIFDSAGPVTETHIQMYSGDTGVHDDVVASEDSVLSVTSLE